MAPNTYVSTYIGCTYGEGMISVGRRTLIEYRENNFRAGSKRKQHALAWIQARTFIDFDSERPWLAIGNSAVTHFFAI